MVKQKKFSIPKSMKQRGTGKEIDRTSAIVYDFMPVLLGNEFRTNDILSKQLFRDRPVSGPMILMEDAYNTLGSRYLKEGQITPALECYKFALREQTGFISFVSAIQENALLTQEEISHLKLDSQLEKNLMQEIARKKRKEIDQDLYNAWIEKLRASYRLYLELNHKEYGTRQYFEVLLDIGDNGEASSIAENLGDKNLVMRIKLARPKEILDVKWLKKYVEENHPESSMFR